MSAPRVEMIVEPSSGLCLQEPKSFHSCLKALAECSRGLFLHRDGLLDVKMKITLLRASRESSS